MLYVIFLIFVVIIAMVIRVSKKDEPQQQSQQPIHFDLMNDNGNPITEPTIAELKYFCTKDSGYYVSVWPKDQNTDILEFDIAGMTYRDKIMLYSGESVGTLEAEPDNQYDKNAIKVIAPDGYMVGYVPRDTTTRVRDFTTLPCRCYFYIGYYTDSEGTHYYSDCYITRKNL